MIRRPPRSTLSSSSAASDVYKRQVSTQSTGVGAMTIMEPLQPLDSNDLSTSNMASDNANQQDVKFSCCECLEAMERGMTPSLDRPDRKGKTPLQYACFLGHQHCASRLIEAGCNPNQQSKTGATPLHFAAVSMFDSSMGVAQLVCESGGDASVQNSAGMTCLDCVKDPERRAIFQELVSDG
eukprot:TRINITY_DN6468_c0_g1_i1.p1 TRINITY_DN6468_c0_g1~~TRINITY_DN6468_c0_g1_i1.p1  ORF type:complete len:182 (+),score=45.19 TRINITY_DN6468_c0_g1_i1:147-692(+)